jgi:hypothetical protein
MIRLEKSARSVKIRNPTLNRCHEQLLNWNGSACAMVNQIRTRRNNPPRRDIEENRRYLTDQLKQTGRYSFSENIDHKALAPATVSTWTMM